MVDGAKGAEAARPFRQARLFKLYKIPEDTGIGDEDLGEQGRLVPVIVENTQRFGRSNRVPVKVGEHLLATGKPDIEEKHDGDALVALTPAFHAAPGRSPRDGAVHH